METGNAILERLKSYFPISARSPSEITQIILETSNIIISHTENFDSDDIPLELLLTACRLLKATCPQGTQYQKQIHENGEVMSRIKKILEYSLNSNDDLKLLKQSFVELLFNISVGELSFEIWNNFKLIFISGLNPDLNGTKYSNVCALMTFNILKDSLVVRGLHESGELLAILRNSLEHIERQLDLEDNIQLLLNYFVSTMPHSTDLYKNLEGNERLNFLSYVHDMVKEKDPVNQDLFDYLIFDFKRSSDAVLKTDGSGAESSKPKELYCLLEIIAASSHSSTDLEETVKCDGSLFLNLGCLLVAVHKLGKNPNNVFAPIQKLDQVAPNSLSDSSYEREISYGFKSLLVQAIGNLLHNNSRNQEIVREMDILLAILECTNIDARNPLLKEYSILAIRNACRNNEENQKVLASLTKVKDVPSDIVKEFTENIIRIQK